MTLDPRKGQFPEVGKLYRMDSYDEEFRTHDVMYLRMLRTHRASMYGDAGFHAVWMTTNIGRSYHVAGDMGSANFFGDDWYRLFTEVPPIQSVGRFL